MTCLDTAEVGVRYLFPVIPLLMVWMGGLAKLMRGRSFRRTALMALAALHALAAASAFPNYLSYFNPLAEIAGGGWRLVRGSDADWGQGLVDLKRYMDRNRIERITLRYFGPADPAYYGIRYEPLTDAERKLPGDKVYAVSVFYLEHVEWSGRVSPTAAAGGSIFIYDFRK